MPEVPHRRLDLDEAGIDYTVRRYLDDAPTPAELVEVLGRLGLEPWDIARDKEAKEEGIDLPRDAPPATLARGCRATHGHPAAITAADGTTWWGATPTRSRRSSPQSRDPADPRDRVRPRRGRVGMRRDQREREFTEFYAGSAAALRRTAYVVVRDWHVAEDLTQQAFAKLYVAWPRVREETRMAYARRAVVNECLSHLRRHRPEPPIDELPERSAPHPSAGPDLGSRPRRAAGPAARDRRAAVPRRPVGRRGRPAARHRRRHREEPDRACPRNAAAETAAPAPGGDPMTQPDTQTCSP